MSVTLPRRRYYMLTSEVEPNWWELNMVNPAPSANSSTAVVVGTHPRCTFLKFVPGSFVTEPNDYDGVGQIDSILLPAGNDAAYDLLVVRHHLFAITYRLLRIDLETFTIDGELSVGFLQGDAARLAYDGTYLYVAGGWNFAVLYRIDPETMTIVDSVPFNQPDPGTGYPGEQYATDVVFDGDYMYVSIYRGDPKIIKFDRYSLTRVAEIPSPVTPGPVSALASSSGYLYAFIQSDPSMVVKIDLSSFTIVDTLTLPSGVYGGDDLAVMDEYLFGALRSPNGGVFRIHLPSFSFAGHTTMDINLGATFRIETFRGRIYAGLLAERGGVAVIDPYSLTVLNVIRTSVGHGITGGLTTGYVFSVAASNSNLYAGMWTLPKALPKISVGTPAGWRNRCVIGGKFSEGDWVFSLKLHNTSQYDMTVRPMLRLYRRHLAGSAPGQLIAEVMAPEPVTIPADSMVTTQLSTTQPVLDYSFHHISLEIKLHIREPTPDPEATCVLVVNEVGDDASWVETPPLTLKPPYPIGL
jgi:hypothetical protein